MHSRISERPFCQAAGCHHGAARAVEIDLPAAWEATQHYTTLTVVVGLCCKHGHDVAGRVRAVLEARSDLYNLIAIVDAAVAVERDLSRRAERAIAEADRHELENGGLRRELHDTQAELRLERAQRLAIPGRLGGVA